MAKLALPIRLQEELMQTAKLSAKRFNRSTTEQVEYWVSLGHRVASELDPDVLLSVSSGLSILKTDPVFNSPLDPDDIFQSLEKD